MGKKLRRFAALALVIMLVAMTLTGCSTKKKEEDKAAWLDTSEAATLIIAGRIRDFKAMEIITQRFMEAYPNCKVEYEYLQDFDETLAKRVASEDDRVDIFITSNIQAESANRVYALDLMAETEKLDLAGTLPGLVDNYKFVENGVTHLYAVPMGGEMRGLYVNKTLLSSLGIETPKNRSELLAACAKLEEAGYVAIQDNPGSFGHRLVFPYIAHLIADAEDPAATRALFEKCDEGAAEILRDPLELIYTLAAENYYNYKYVETECGRFLDLSDEGMARSFLNITGTEGAYEKADDLGAVPFMTSADSLRPTIDKIKDDYHSQIEYEFILVPVSEKGGYAYMSPTTGLAVNKDSKHIDWCLAFMNFFFDAENNKIFAETYSVTGNTSDALKVISEKYGIPEGEIHQPADIAFSYNLYNLIVDTLVNTAKANNPKYMQEDGTIYPFEHYLDMLKEAFAQQRSALEE